MVGSLGKGVTLSIDSRQDRVSQVLEECEAFWVLSSIPHGKVDEMKLELEQHLREASRDGKPVETVVGDDVLLFARSWAEENGPPRSLVREILDWVLMALLYTTIVMTAHHLFSWSLSFDVYWYTLALVLIASFGAVFWVSPRILVGLSSIESRWKRELLVFCVLALLIGTPMMLAVTTGGSIGAPLFEWPWFATLISALTSVALWIGRDDPSVPAYEDEMNEERVEVNRGFVLLALVVPLSGLAAILAASLGSSLVFLLWWGIPGLFALLFPPESSARWRKTGGVGLGMGMLLTALMLALA